MHGQKRWRKRTLAGTFRLNGLLLEWALVSEPQWSSSTRTYLGMRVLIRVAAEARRELLIEFPFPRDRGGWRLSLPQRPAFRAADIEAATRSALAEGWDPASRGRVHYFVAPELVN